MDFKVLISPENLKNILDSLLPNFLKKGDVFTNEESKKIFADKLLEHNHPNKDCIDLLTMDLHDVYFKGNKILTTALKPTTYPKEWKSQINSESTMIIDVKSILTDNLYSAIIASEFNIRNDIASVDTTTDALEENQLHLIVSDNGITTLDVLISPANTQEYVLGISPNIKIYVKGSFSANYYMTVY